MTAQQLTKLIVKINDLAEELGRDPGQFLHSSEVTLVGDQLWTLGKQLTEELGRMTLAEFLRSERP